MGTLDKIIVAIDNSKISEEVLKRALLLANKNGSIIVIVHIINTPLFEAPDYFGGDKTQKIDQDEIKSQIENKIATLNNNPNIKCLVLVDSGDISDKIIHEAKQIDGQMIILGAHSTEELTTKKVGTTAKKIIQDSHLPIIIVKNPANKIYNNILAPTDLSDFSKKSILFTKNILKDGNIKLVYIYEEPVDKYIDYYNLSQEDKLVLDKKTESYIKADLKKFKENVGIETSDFIKCEITLENDLVNHIKNHKNDLVIIGSHGVKNIESFLFGSTAAFLMAESSSDILVYVPE